MGFSTKDDCVYPDLAFSLPTHMLPNDRYPDRKGSVIGVGLINYYNRRALSDKDETVYRQYLKNIASLIAGLLQQKYTVRVLIGDVVYDEGVRHDLKRLLEERGLEYEGGRVIDEPASSVGELLSQLAATDIV